MQALTRYYTNPLVLIIVITLGGLALGGHFWSSYRARLQADADQRVRWDQVELTATPDWLPSEWAEWHRAEFEKQSLSLWQSDLVETVAATFTADPWVAEVQEVRKSPGRLSVQVRYGEPLLVELPEQRVLPIDPAGRVVDVQKFPLRWSDRFIRVAVPEVQLRSLEADKLWPDERVLRAAELARTLVSVREPANMAGIYAYWTPAHLAETALETAGGPRGGDEATGGGSEETSATDRRGAVELRVWTEGRNELIWGSAPGREAVGEASAEQKIRGLQDFLKQHGPIDTWAELPNQQGNVLDLRGGQVRLVRQARQAYRPESVTGAPGLGALR